MTETKKQPPITTLTIRRLLANSSEVVGPEANLAFAVIGLAIFDCKVTRGSSRLRIPAIEFLTDGSCDPWCDMVGLRHEWPWEIAQKLFGAEKVDRWRKAA